MKEIINKIAAPIKLSRSTLKLRDIKMYRGRKGIRSVRNKAFKCSPDVERTFFCRATVHTKWVLPRPAAVVHPYFVPIERKRKITIGGVARNAHACISHMLGGMFTFCRQSRNKGAGRYFYSLTCRSLLSRSARVPLRRLAVMASSSPAAASAKALPNGLYPTMITPFLNDDKKSVDWNGLDSESKNLHN